MIRTATNFSNSTNVVTAHASIRASNNLALLVFIKKRENTHQLSSSYVIQELLVSTIASRRHQNTPWAGWQCPQSDHQAPEHRLSTGSSTCCISLPHFLQTFCKLGLKLIGSHIEMKSILLVVLKLRELTRVVRSLMLTSLPARIFF